MAQPCVERPSRIGFGEILIVAVPLVVIFVLGYLVGKGAGFKQGLREAGGLRRETR